MEVSAVIVSHNREEQLRNMIWQLENQTKQFKSIELYVSGYKDQLKDLESKYTIHYEPDRKDWGHEKRAKAIQDCKSEYILCASDDDIYPYHFLELVLKHSETEPGHDIYAVDWRTQRESDSLSLGYHIAEPRIGGVTSGCMVIKVSKANEVGYRHRDFGADGRFCVDMVEHNASFSRVPYTAFFHY